MEIYFLSMTILTLMSFYLAQSLRSAINNKKRLYIEKSLIKIDKLDINTKKSQIELKYRI